MMLVLLTSFMLFSMFFGAGNLIFPAYLGVEAGTNYWPSIIGFLVSGVLLPVLAIIAIAISGNNVRDLAARGGYLFGLLFPILAYLSIGAFYALPRTGAVSYEIVVAPLIEDGGIATSGLFNVIFFLIAFAFAYRPNTIVDSLGRVLTPMLVILLAIMITIAVSKFADAPAPTPSDGYASAPLPTGLLEGYLTMDSIAALAFGIVVISSFKSKGVANGSTLVRSTILAGIGAGILLGAIYVGLGLIGNRMPDSSRYTDGSRLLADAAQLTMGSPGQLAFGLIVLLACMTTAIGLIASTSEFFHYLAPRVSYHQWAILFTVMSAGLATMGLDTVLAVAAPVVSFIYPPAITLILITIAQPLYAKRFYPYWTYRIAIWIAVIWSGCTVLASIGLKWLSTIVDWAPLHNYELGWLLPVFVGIVVGIVLDHTVPRGRKPGFVADIPPH